MKRVNPSSPLERRRSKDADPDILVLKEAEAEYAKM